MISSIHAVGKHRRAPEIMKFARSLKDFAGTNNMRIIITHADVRDVDANEVKKLFLSKFISR